MKSSHLVRVGVTIGALVLGLAATSAAARAEVSVEAGGLFGGNNTSAAGIVSLGLLTVPLSPVSAELSVIVPFSNGGYAATVDARANFAGTTLGAGIGLGSLGTSGATGVNNNVARTTTMYDAIVARTIAPHTSLEGRVYFAANRSSTVFAGLRLSL